MMTEEFSESFSGEIYCTFGKCKQRVVKLIPGATYRIEPMNPLKKKDRGRIGALIAIVDLGGAGRFRFADNNRVGTIKLDDLVLMEDQP